MKIKPRNNEFETNEVSNGMEINFSSDDAEITVKEDLHFFRYNKMFCEIKARKPSEKELIITM